MTNEEIQKALDALQERNRRVEADKAWETSWTRKLVVLVLTYFVVVVFFVVADLGNPFVNAIVPTIGFFLSTITAPLVKRWWLQRVYKR